MSYRNAPRIWPQEERQGEEETGRGRQNCGWEILSSDARALGTVDLIARPVEYV